MKPGPGPGTAFTDRPVPLKGAVALISLQQRRATRELSLLGGVRVSQCLGHNEMYRADPR